LPGMTSYNPSCGSVQLETQLISRSACTRQSAAGNEEGSNSSANNPQAIIRAVIGPPPAQGMVDRASVHQVRVHRLRSSVGLSSDGSLFRHRLVSVRRNPASERKRQIGAWNTPSATECDDHPSGSPFIAGASGRM